MQRTGQTESKKSQDLAVLSVSFIEDSRLWILRNLWVSNSLSQNYCDWQTAGTSPPPFFLFVWIWPKGLRSNSPNSSFHWSPNLGFICLVLRVVWSLSLSPLSPLFTLPSDSALHSGPGSPLPEALGTAPQMGSHGPASARISSAPHGLLCCSTSTAAALYPTPAALCLFILWHTYPSSVYYA